MKITARVAYIENEPLHYPKGWKAELA